MVWLSNGMFFSFLQNTRTWRTDGQTDTARQHRPRLWIASRGKKAQYSVSRTKAGHITSKNTERKCNIRCVHMQFLNTVSYAHALTAILITPSGFLFYQVSWKNACNYKWRLFSVPKIIDTGPDFELLENVNRSHIFETHCIFSCTVIKQLILLFHCLATSC